MGWVGRRCLIELTLGFGYSSRQLHFNVDLIKEQPNNSVLTSELGEKCFNMTALLKRQRATCEERKKEKPHLKSE